MGRLDSCTYTEILEALDRWLGSLVLLEGVASAKDAIGRDYVGWLRRLPDTGDGHRVYLVPTEPADPELTNPEGVAFAIDPRFVCGTLGPEAQLSLRVGTLRLRIRSLG